MILKYWVLYNRTDSLESSEDDGLPDLNYLIPVYDLTTTLVPVWQLIIVRKAPGW